MIEIGDQVPDVELRTIGPDGPQTLGTADLFESGRSVLFAVPGAFTPGCSRTHLPGYVERADDLLARGVDRIVCVAVNDAYVMDAWGQAHGAGNKILMLADGNGEFTRAVGLEQDMSDRGLGRRSHRYAAVIEGGVVTNLAVDPPGTIDASSCAAVIGLL
jgi:peroxiredoxin